MTIYDIAENLGVSAATVSLALNGDRRVAERTRERVVSYAARNGFKRNEQARNFRLKRTCNVAIVVHNIDNDFWYGIVKAVEETLGEAYNVILCNTEGDPGKEEKIFRNLQRRNVDGVIVQPASEREELFLELVHDGIPVISLEETRSPELSFVKGDDYRVARQVTELCIENGHRKLAFLITAPYCFGVEERVRGFQEALSCCGATGEIFVAAERSCEAVEAVLLERIPEFSVILSDDVVLFPLIRVLAFHGIRVPEDLSLIGWNNSRHLACLKPSISSITIPMNEIGRRAAEIVLRNLDGDRNAEKCYIEDRIILRESFRPFHNSNQGGER